jgi:hypothetical protein
MDEAQRRCVMFDVTTAQAAFSSLLSIGDPRLDQLGLDVDETIVVQDDWTGSLPLDDWSPATGETILIDDHVRELGHDVIRYTDACLYSVSTREPTKSPKHS